MKNIGFTLVELIAAIAVLSILTVMIVPNIIKKYNNSKIEAIVIQENKLVEAGDILLDDYCKDAISKKKCEIYYQELPNKNDSSVTEEYKTEYNKLNSDKIISIYV